jgi:glycosyltransferase involved in cell wall biosynthesis
VLQQTYSNYELILVDDGSTDDTRERLQKYTAIRYVYQANRGVSAARNAGVNLARGEWIAFLDSDDIWHPTKLERQFEALENLGSEFGACVTDCKYVGNPAWNSSVFEANGLISNSAFGPLDNPIRYIGRQAYATCIQSLLMLHSVFDKAGGFDESLGVGEDRDFIVRLSFKTRLCFVSSPLVSIDRSASGPRLTDLCSRRDDYVYLWSEKLCTKILAHPEFVDQEERQIVRDELIGVYYSWAAARVSDLNFISGLRKLKKIRQLGQSYPAIFRTMLSRMGRKFMRTLRPRSND